MTVSALAASLLVAGGTLPAQADPKPNATPVAPVVTTFPRPEDPDAALRAGIEEARKQNRPVEVEAAGTEKSRSWANPDGTITMQSYAAPARVKQADGSWAWIDTTLLERDGVLKPKAGRADIAFSQGGDGKAFASMERGEKGQRFALDWPTSLPRPEVTGNVARYVDAAGTGADLVLTALPTGFRHDVVLREKPKGDVEFRIPVRTEDLKLTESKDGRLRLADTKGKVVAEAPAPVMYDSTEPDTTGKGLHRSGAIDTRVVTENGESVLVLKPDAAFLADPVTVYPVVVDPTTTLTLQTDTYLHSNYTGNDQPGSTSLKVGGETWRPSGSTATVIDYNRSLLKFDTASLVGRAIASAQLELWAPSGSRCDVYGGGLKVSRLGGAWTAGQVTWANQPSTVESGSQLQLCPAYADGVYPRTFTWAIKDIVSSWAGGTSNHGLQVRIANESMTWGQNGAIEFHSAETTGTDARPPKLTVDYMLPPEIPAVTAESIDSMAGNDAIARSTSVKVGFKSSVAEASNLDYTVTVNDSTMGTPPAIPTGETAYWKFDEASGTTATDSSGGGFPATLKGTASRDTGQLGKALKLVNDEFTDPNDAYAVTTKPVLNTNQSFSVSAWARLDDSVGTYTVVSQLGTTQSGFELAYHEYQQKWWFAMPTADVTPTTKVVLASDRPAQINTWTHLVAVYDATAQKLRLYVDGRLAGEKAHTSTWNARSNFQIGRTKVDGSFSDYLNGAIDDVHVYSRVLTDSDVRALHGSPTATTHNGIPSGQVIDKIFALDNPASFKFVVKACRSGVTPPSCNESPAYRITSDAPMLPTDTETGMADPMRPILSGMVNRPSGDPVTAKYFLYDSTGAPVGSSPLGERNVNGGERASFQLPENTVQPGGTYTWQMQTCALEICTAKTTPVSFTTPGTPPDPPAETVNHLTLLKDNFVFKTAKVDPTACGGSPCTVTDSTVMQIGGSGTDKTVAVIGFKLDELPDGAGVSEGILKLGTPTCPAGTCPADAIITATPLKSQVTGETKGPDLAGDVDTSTTPYSLPLSGPQADIAGSEYQWLMLTSNKDEVITFGDTAAAEQPSLALTYLPAGPPSKVLNLTTQGGDASAIASWGLPESNGGIAMLDGYDVEVTESSGAVIETLDVKDPWVAITGLANETTYTVRVRAKTAFGVGGWETASVTTKAVPPPPVRGGGATCVPFLDSRSTSSTANVESGAQAYIDRVKAYYQAQDAVLEGRANTIWDAPGVTADAPSTAKLSLLNAELVHAKTAMDETGTVRSGSVVEIPSAVVQALPDGTVRVTAEVKRSWIEQTSATSASAKAVRSAAGTPGQVEPSEAIIDIFVFDRCGGTTIIQVPLEVEQDSTDFYYDEEWEAYLSTGLIPGETVPLATTQSQAKVDAANAVSGECDANPEDGNNGKDGSWVKEKPGYSQYKLLKKQRHPTTRILWKGWQLHAEARSIWCHPNGEDYSSLTTETWRIPRFINYVRVYTIGPWKLRTNDELAEYKYILNNLVIKSAGEACFKVEQDGTTAGISVAIDADKVGTAGVYLELNGSVEATCKPYEKAGPIKPTNPDPNDTFRLKAVWTKKTAKAECFEGPTSRCELTGYQHRFEPEVTFCHHVTARVADCSEWIPNPYYSWWHDFLGRKNGSG
ncbi:LamG-like jellyroll fold domain-containing protein [Streptosporangium amethystogenes subsp. fukuiense]|uniref:LamG-like jellyroll fold domain-containing protein n=1 Tax=Streptosporangium amethystogenes subsp. fukuiense TaxID=698418 RepID=A0ABW2T013_9ACTN